MARRKPEKVHKHIKRNLVKGGRFKVDERSMEIRRKMVTIEGKIKPETIILVIE